MSAIARPDMEALIITKNGPVAVIIKTVYGNETTVAMKSKPDVIGSANLRELRTLDNQPLVEWSLENERNLEGRRPASTGGQWLCLDCGTTYSGYRCPTCRSNERIYNTK